MTRLIALCATALALLFSNPVYAGWYGSIQAGGNWLQDSDVTATAGPLAGSGEVDFDNGWGVAGAVGYSYPSGLRVEGELSYRTNDLDSSEGVSLGGDVDALGVLVNVWYDFKTDGKWKPYIGGGIGAAEVGLDLESVGGAPVSFSDEDWVFAYQLGVGVAFPVASKTMLSVDYRYFATSDPEFEESGVTLDAEYRSHSLMIGLRFEF